MTITLKYLPTNHSVMSSIEKLKYRLAVMAHREWKRGARVLLLGGHLSREKSTQYDRGLVEFDALEPYYQNSYLGYAGEVINVCLKYIGVLNEASD